jgi:hypothetical protein
MRWLAWLRRRLSTPPEIEIHTDKARKAVAVEHERARSGRADAAKARRVQRSLREIREENHFAEIMRDAMRP